MSCFSTCLQATGDWWRFRTIMERFFIIVFIIICLLIIIFASTGSRGVASIPTTCNSSLCLNEASKVLRFRDDAVNHCKNFYSYVCGNFLKTAEVNEKLTLEEFQRKQLLEYYNSQMRLSDHEMVNVAKTLFESCLMSREREDEQIRILKKVLKIAGGWPVVEGPSWDDNAYNWTTATYALRERGYPFRIFLDLTIQPDPAAENSYILKTSTANTTDYLYALNEKDKVELMTDVALIFGAKDRVSVWKEMQEAYDFWKKLNEIQYPATTIGPFSRMKSEDYQRIFGSFNLLEFNNLIIMPPYELARQHQHLFPPELILTRWLDLISATPKRTQANYMMWKVVELTIPYMHCELRVGKSGTKRDETFSEFCMRETEQRFAFSPIRYLVDRRYLPLEKREQVDRLLGAIKLEFLHMLENAKWIEEKDSAKLMQRVMNLAFVIGRPEHYFGDYILDKLKSDMVRFANHSFLDLIAQANRNLESLKYHQFMLARSESVLEKWYIDNYEPAYIKEENAIHIPGAVIQRFFHSKNPNYLNYGKLGAILAPHIGAVIADVLSRNTWSGNTKEEFDKDIMCFEKEMSNCIEKATMASTSCIEQVSTLAQHTIGMKVTYAAYKKWQIKNQDFPLIATNYSQNQLFWIAGALMSCPRGKNRGFYVDLEYEYKKVFLSIVNNDNFASDFNCPTISERKC